MCRDRDAQLLAGVIQLFGGLRPHPHVPPVAPEVLHPAARRGDGQARLERRACRVEPRAWSGRRDPSVGDERARRCGTRRRRRAGSSHRRCAGQDRARSAVRFLADGRRSLARERRSRHHGVSGTGVPGRTAGSQGGQRSYGGPRMDLGLRSCSTSRLRAHRSWNWPEKTPSRGEAGPLDAPRTGSSRGPIWPRCSERSRQPPR